MTDATILDLATYRTRSQLRQSIVSLRQNFSLPPAVNTPMPPVPNAGFHLGSFVRLPDNAIGWISERKETPFGALVLTVRVAGRARVICARDCVPVGAG